MFMIHHHFPIAIHNVDYCMHHHAVLTLQRGCSLVLGQIFMRVMDDRTRSK